MQRRHNRLRRSHHVEQQSFPPPLCHAISRVKFLRPGEGKREGQSKGWTWPNRRQRRRVPGSFPQTSVACVSTPRRSAVTSHPSSIYLPFPFKWPSGAEHRGLRGSEHAPCDAVMMKMCHCTWGHVHSTSSPRREPRGKGVPRAVGDDTWQEVRLERTLRLGGRI